MERTAWLALILPLGGAGVSCLALLLRPRWRLEGSRLANPLADPARACTLVLLFTALVLIPVPFRRYGEEVAWRIWLDAGGDLALLVLALLPATRRVEAGWARVGFGAVRPRAVPWLLLLAAGVAVFRLVLLVFVPCQCPGLDPDEDGWLRVALSGGFYALLVPVVEEILYRGIVLPLAAVRVGGWGAVLVATFAWAMAHGQAPLLPLIALGIALGWLTLATGSLWASIAFHVAWNGSVVGYEITRAVWGAGAGGPVPGWLIFVAVAAFVLGWARVLDVAREGGIRAVWAPPEGSR